MLRKLRFVPLFLTAIAAHAATLQQLSMDQMSQLATTVVRARVIGSSASIYATPGSPTIYTHYQLDVSEVWKGAATSEVMLPGGQVNGKTQRFPGVPELHVGTEYVLFLWKSPATGIVHTMGLTQGIFDVTAQPDGIPLASRRQTGELMLDAAGHSVADHAISMRLADMKTRVRQTPAAVSAAISANGTSK
jgi:hypothetical protein